MTLLAGDVIEAARDRHMAFVRELAPQGMCLRFLTQYHSALLGKIAKLDEDALRVDTPVAMPLADFAAGITLPVNREVVAVTGTTSGGLATTFDITLVPVALRNDRSTPFAAAWQAGEVLYLRGSAQNWAQVGSITLATVPVPAAITKSTQALVVPDTALQTLVENVAFLLAKRGHNQGDKFPPIDTGAFASAAGEAERAYLDEVRLRVASRATHTRDVMHNFD